MYRSAFLASAQHKHHCSETEPPSITSPDIRFHSCWSSAGSLLQITPLVDGQTTSFTGYVQMPIGVNRSLFKSQIHTQWNDMAAQLVNLGIGLHASLSPSGLLFLMIFMSPWITIYTTTCVFATSSHVFQVHHGGFDFPYKLC